MRRTADAGRQVAFGVERLLLAAGAGEQQPETAPVFVAAAGQSLAARAAAWRGAGRRGIPAVELLNRGLKGS